MFERLGDRLCEAARGASEAVLVAPFIKRGALARVLEALPINARVRCVTRWRPEEILAGVSDLEVWPLLRNRQEGAPLGLIDTLHAKYYRFEERCWIGSANLTDTALAWRQPANLELLIAGESTDYKGFEQMVLDSALPVDDGLYYQMRQLVVAMEQEGSAPVAQASDASFIAAKPEPSVTVAPTPEGWTPMLRNPEQLFAAYQDGGSELTRAAREQAASDLAVLALPAGLGHAAFTSYVAWRMLQMPVVRSFDSFAKVPRRFSEGRSHLNSLFATRSVDFDATYAWQTLMRWLLYFLPERYAMKTPNYSEVFFRR